jgi:Holliday junction DNA helicase RuvA
MIGFVRGLVIDRDHAIDRPAGEIIVETGGVGYRLVVTAATLAKLPGSGEVALHVHHHFWEADQKLYGFATKDERVAFEGLLGAHKVGPALALAIIATHPPADLARILADDDLDALCDVPGVGKKTAQRLLVDLKSSLVLPVLDTVDGAPEPAAGGNGVLADVRGALVELGYSSEEVRRAVAALPPDPDADAGQLLKLALRQLAG